MADDRQITVTTPLGPDALKFARMEGEDRVNGCFEFTLVMVSEDTEIDAARILGEPVTVKVGSETVRHFHGFVAAFGLREFRDGLAHYVATVRPWLWFLSTNTDCRIFQNKSVVEIIEEVFSDYPNATFDNRLQESYPPREYCVQYDESDLDFVQRLMEHEGIFYFFEYADGAHKLVLADSNAKLAPVPGFETVPFQPDTSPTRDEHDFVTHWEPVQAVMPAAYAHTDFDFEKPAADLMARSDQAIGHSLDDGEHYAHPGAHLTLDRGDTIAAIRREELQAPCYRATGRGSVRGLMSGCTFTLERFPREIENAEFIVLGVRYRMWDPEYRTGSVEEESAEGYEIAFTAAPSAVAYRPPRTTRQPVMRGPQTATVVGPAGEEIFTDKYARVKVQFHWDRKGTNDENSSCFVRVSSAWAGSGWGFIQIPRIGQEVIVDFIEGDPDKPVITGRVYNGANMPPYDLPGNATQSGWKSNSSLGGGGWNELRFEDKKGAEEVYFQAEKDHNELVKNDESRLIQHDMSERVDNNSSQSIGVNRDEDVGQDKTTAVGRNRTVNIGNNDDETVGVNRSLKVGSNESIIVGANSTETIAVNHAQTVGAAQEVTVGGARLDTVGGAETRSVGGAQMQNVGLARDVNVGAAQSHNIGAADSWTIGAAQSVTVGADQSVTVGASQSSTIGADHSLAIGSGSTVTVGKTAATEVGEDCGLKVGKNYTLDVGDQITLKCGDATIVLKKDGKIQIKGKELTLDSSGKINIKAGGDVVIKGSKIHQN